MALLTKSWRGSERPFHSLTIPLHNARMNFFLVLKPDLPRSYLPTLIPHFVAFRSRVQRSLPDKMNAKQSVYKPGPRNEKSCVLLDHEALEVLDIEVIKREHKPTREIQQKVTRE